jgi:hypothetical protein
LIKNDQNFIEPTFQWKDKHDNFHFPSDMETRHLFYTLKMIWNHTMPFEAKIVPYKLYDFGPYYTEEYLKKAIYYITIELSTRNDMKPNWQIELQRMIDYLKNFSELKELEYGCLYRSTK